MRQGTARETVVKKPHRYRFYQTKKPRTQRQNLSNGNKFIGSMKTLENTQNNAGLSVLFDGAMSAARRSLEPACSPDRTA
jgi:hypothetical protein